MRATVYVCLLLVFLQSTAFTQEGLQNRLVIKGQVLDETGLPVSGVSVTAHRDAGLRGKVPTASSNARGEFTIAVSQTGSYTVTTAKPSEGYPSSFNPFYYPFEESLAHVNVETDQPAPVAVVRLGAKAGTLSGRLVDAETGRPIGDAEIHLCRAEVPKYCYRVAARYVDGEFSFLVPTDPFTVRISAQGFHDWNGDRSGDGQSAVFQVKSKTTKAIDVLFEKLPADKSSAADLQSLAAPQPVAPVGGAQFDHFPRATKLEWSPVSGAASYTIELQVCAQGDVNGNECGGLLQLRGNPPLSGIEKTSYEFLFIGAQPGRWRVWAVDSNGRAGGKSDWLRFIFKQ